MGARLRGLRRGGEAPLAARPRATDLRLGGVGRARRLRRPRARELGTAIPHHLGDRPGTGRHLRAPADRTAPRLGPPWGSALRAPAPRRRTHRRRRVRRRRARGGAGALRSRAGCRVITKSSEQLRIPCASGRGGQWWNRRQPRPGPQELAGADGSGPRAAAQRGARPCGRSDAGHLRGCGRKPHQRRPDVALHRGHHQLRPDLAPARHPHPARAVVPVAGRDRQASARAAVPRVRHAGHLGVHRQDRPRLHLVRLEFPDHRARNSACPARSRTPI